ncbi:hypothetical protein EVAR_50069_1 [Eumeta japonica]|uniref:Uncharacterized protein n=1 Tax=Eumeta variegata TaxID=151549 RepID=A0A4C1XI97_EUMVA|nr:hypothetical protein EVAR_50069_1 [Eumeta japonica]
MFCPAKRRSSCTSIDFSSSSPYLIIFWPYVFPVACDKETCSDCGDTAAGVHVGEVGELHSCLQSHESSSFDADNRRRRCSEITRAEPIAAPGLFRGIFLACAIVEVVQFCNPLNAFSRGERASCKPPECRWSLPPIDSRNPSHQCVASIWDRNKISTEGRNGLMERSRPPISQQFSLNETQKSMCNYNTRSKLHITIKRNNRVGNTALPLLMPRTLNGKQFGAESSSTAAAPFRSTGQPGDPFP